MNDLTALVHRDMDNHVIYIFFPQTSGDIMVLFVYCAQQRAPPTTTNPAHYLLDDDEYLMHL